MGLDVYVGTLTRYLAGDWELVAQQAAREMGLPITVVRQHEQEEAIKDLEQIRPVVLAWREGLSNALEGSLKEPLLWDESGEAGYFTDKPTWDCFIDLTLWAAYEEQRQFLRPSHHVEELSEDPAYNASADDLNSRYSHLFGVELWLPCPFGLVFSTPFVTGGDPIFVGSSIALVQQLEELNQRTWQASPESLTQWRFEGAEHGSPMETGARFAFALMLGLAQHSVEHQLPMKLDW